MGVLFRGVGVVAAMPNISPDQATTSILVGIASCTLSYRLSYRDHYDFGLCHTYGVPSDNHRFWWGLWCCIDYGIINRLRGVRALLNPTLISYLTD